MSSILANATSYGVFKGDQQLTVGSTAVALTVPDGAVGAMITNGAEAIRVRWTGTGGGDPTASVGHYLNPYSVMDLYTSDMTKVKLIRVASDSDIQVSYFGLDN
jgi:hypothetical protein|tara:strand:- start:918 stop:1229 length:312 start_codon:yes stop_codon:yes gene_type:complete